MIRCKLWIVWLIPLVMLGCGGQPFTSRSGLKTSNFHTMVDGEATELYVLSNKKGMEVCITNYGGRIVSLLVPDRKGKLQDVVLGFDSIGEYLRYPSDLGAVVGRFAGGIHSRKMNYHPVREPSDIESDHNSRGFQNKVFDAQQFGEKKLVLTYISKDGEEGFPGNLVCSMTYKLTDDNTLDISFTAETDRPSMVNLSAYIYFNLSGDPALPCTDELLTIHAKNFLPVNSASVPMGTTAKVAGTPMNFQHSTAIDKNSQQGTSTQLKNGHGFNHYYLLGTKGDINKVGAQLISLHSGIAMHLFTSEPILLFYSGNRLDGTMYGKRHIAYNQHAALVLAPQGYPDATNPPSFWPSRMLKPGKPYQWHTVYRFTTLKK